MNRGFALATLVEDGRRNAALVLDDGCWPLDALSDGRLPATVRGLLNDWDTSMTTLQGLAAACRDGRADPALRRPAAACEFGAPVEYPNKVIGVAANYGEWFRAMGLPATRWSPSALFMRPPTTTVVGPGASVCMPFGSDQLDWEVELAVVMGARMRNVSPEHAMLGVAGYSVAVDFTVKDLVDVATPFKVDLFRSKCQDGLSPLGPVLRPSAFVENPQQLALKLWVNGVLRQSGHTSDMLYTIAELISDVSRNLTWEPGDVLLSGTPSGSAGASGRYLKAGDQLTAEVEGIGRLDLTIRPPTLDAIGPDRPPSLSSNLSEPRARP